MSNNEQELGGQRIPQTHCRSDDRVEAGPIRVGNQVAREKLHQRPPHANVDDELRHDEERQRDEKPRVYFDVEQKGDLDVSPPRSPLPRREQQQRQPRDQHAGENAAMDQRQGIVGEVRPAKQLKQRAAEHEGEVGRPSASGSGGVFTWPSRPPPSPPPVAPAARP